MHAPRPSLASCCQTIVQTTPSHPSTIRGNMTASAASNQQCYELLRHCNSASTLQHTQHAGNTTMMRACWQPQSSWRCAAACCSRRTTCAHQHQQQQVPSTPMLQPCTNTQSCAHEANPGHRNDLTLTSPRQPGTAQKHHAHRVATP